MSTDVQCLKCEGDEWCHGCNGGGEVDEHTRNLQVYFDGNPPSEEIDIVFDGPPSHESGRFIEVERKNGVSIKIGEWIERPDGYWALRLRAVTTEPPTLEGKDAA